ncbi:MAG TPA: transposase domain-containing protein [Paenirhodobacter sp.]
MYFGGNKLGATYKLAGASPVDYLADTLRAILDGQPRSRIKNLMPWRYTQASSLAA